MCDCSPSFVFRRFQRWDFQLFWFPGALGKISTVTAGSQSSELVSLVCETEQADINIHIKKHIIA